MNNVSCNEEIVLPEQVTKFTFMTLIQTYTPTVYDYIIKLQNYFQKKYI